MTSETETLDRAPEAPPADPDRARIEATRAPLLEHLIELRRRLLWSLAALGVAFAGCLYFAKPIFAFLVQPLLRAGQGRLV